MFIGEVFHLGRKIRDLGNRVSPASHMNTSESGYAIFERHFQKYTPITLHYDFSQRDQINSLRNGRDPDLKQIENAFKDPEDGF